MKLTPYVQPSDIECRLNRLTDELSALLGSRPFALLEMLHDRIPYTVASHMRLSDDPEAAVNFYEAKAIKGLRDSYKGIVRAAFMTEAQLQGFNAAIEELTLAGKSIPAAIPASLPNDMERAKYRRRKLVGIFEALHGEKSPVTKKFRHLGELAFETAHVNYTMVSPLFLASAVRERRRLLHHVRSNWIALAYQTCAIMDIKVAIQAMRLDFGIDVKGSEDNTTFFNNNMLGVMEANAYIKEADILQRMLVAESPRAGMPIKKNASEPRSTPMN